jgi:hypothetical protein
MTENRLPTTGKQKDRAHRLVATIKKLKSLKKSIEKRGKVAPKGCLLRNIKFPRIKRFIGTINYRLTSLFLKQ